MIDWDCYQNNVGNCSFFIRKIGSDGAWRLNYSLPAMSIHFPPRSTAQECFAQLRDPSPDLDKLRENIGHNLPDMPELSEWPCSKRLPF